MPRSQAIKELGQIVGADRQEIDAAQEGRQLPQQRGHFQHDPELDRARRLDALPRGAGQFLVEQAAGAFELGDLGNHREFDQEIAAGGGAQQSAQLLAQHRRAIEPDADGAPAHRRIVLGRVRQIGQHLVAADIERAEHDRPPLGLFVGAPVEGGLIGDIGKGVAGQQRDLGAEQTDPLGAGRAQLREVEQQPGIEQELDLDPVAGDRRGVSQGLVKRAGAACGRRRAAATLCWISARGRISTVPCSPSTMTMSPASICRVASATRPTTGISKARATIATWAVGEPSSSTSPLIRRCA